MKQFKGIYNSFSRGKTFKLDRFPLFPPILAIYLQGGKADIDQYYSIETENELILTFFDYELKGIGPFTPEKTYRFLTSSYQRHEIAPIPTITYNRHNI